MIDNTWGIHTFQPFFHGCDVSIQALTKYVAGHSDVLLGSVCVNSEAHHLILRAAATAMGHYASPDDCWLALRGVRTMPVEATENVAPVIFWQNQIRPDSAGAGRTRGGFGKVMEIGAKGDAEFAVNAIFDRVANAPKGREGGGDGAPGWVGHTDGTTIRTKGFQVIPKGKRLLLKLPGGGGMGDARQRDRALVERDVADGLVSPDQAKALYGG
jgi:hypothetical protein